MTDIERGQKTMLTRFREANKDREDLLLALDLALYTGQRQGDILAMSESDYDGKHIKVLQNKTGTFVKIKVIEPLKSRLDSLPRGRFRMLLSRSGKPYKEHHFRRQFRKAILEAGLGGLVFHGLRKTATIKLIEAGCTDAQAQAITGHKTGEMIRHYRAQADATKLANEAMEKLEQSQYSLLNSEK